MSRSWSQVKVIFQRVQKVHDFLLGVADSEIPSPAASFCSLFKLQNYYLTDTLVNLSCVRWDNSWSELLCSALVSDKVLFCRRYSSQFILMTL